MTTSLPELPSAAFARPSGEIPYIITDAGLILPEDDVPAWSRAIDRLLVDLSLRTDLAARGLARARAEYALDVVARRHLEFFGDLMDNPAG